jgi:uncharacterized membrane protein YfhO
MNSRFPWPELVAAGCVALSQFVEVHIWSPAYSYFLVMLLVVLDVLTDLVLSQRPWRPKVLLLILPAYTVIMAFAHSFGKNEVALSWLPQAVIVLIVLIHLRRLIRNFSKLHLMDGDVATVLDAKLSRRIEKVDAEPEPAAPGTETTQEPVSDEAVPA